MSVSTKTELEVREIFNYPNPLKRERRFMVIEYEVIRKEIKRYILFQSDKK